MSVIVDATARWRDWWCKSLDVWPPWMSVGRPDALICCQGKLILSMRCVNPCGTFNASRHAGFVPINTACIGLIVSATNAIGCVWFHMRVKRGFHPAQRCNGRNTTDGTDATTDEASDRPFDTTSSATFVAYFSCVDSVHYALSCVHFLACVALDGNRALLQFICACLSLLGTIRQPAIRHNIPEHRAHIKHNNYVDLTVTPNSA